MPPLATPATIVDRARNLLALTVTDAGRVFRVSRPTIYQWQSIGDIGQIRSHKDRQRLKDMWSIAETWSKLTPLKGRWLNHILPGGKSLLDLLSVEKIDVAAVLSAHASLSMSQQELRGKEHQRVLQVLPGLRDAFKNLDALTQQRDRQEDG